jgi:prepilin-type N-terminal cleavage/methylation domain-containing protein
MAAPQKSPRVDRQPPARTDGFTLLELLISMTILALIFAAILGAIRVGMRSWESGEQRAEDNQRTRTLVDTLARDLSMIHPLRMKESDKDIVVFRGQSDSLTFATLPQSYGAAPFSHMMRVVTYTVEPGSGLVAGESYPILGPADAVALPEGRTRSVDDRVMEARFRYLVPQGRPDEGLPPTWRDFWDPSQDDTFTTTPAPSPLAAGLRAGQRALKGSGRLPLAVEIALTIRLERRQGPQELILPPLVFPVHVGRTL